MFKHIYHFICPALILAVLSGCLSTKEDPIASRPSEEQALADTEPAADTTDTPETTSAVVLEDTPEEDESPRMYSRKTKSRFLKSSKNFPWQWTSRITAHGLNMWIPTP